METTGKKRISNPKTRIAHLRNKARDKGIPFNLTESDLAPPESCPVLGTPLGDSFTVDRIVPALGYTKGNIILISDLANRIKTNAVPSEILRVGYFYQRLMSYNE